MTSSTKPEVHQPLSISFIQLIFCAATSHTIISPNTKKFP